MGKYLKTPMDHKIVDYLSIELFKLDPNNEHLKQLMRLRKLMSYQQGIILMVLGKKVVDGFKLIWYNTNTGEILWEIY